MMPQDTLGQIIDQAAGYLYKEAFIDLDLLVYWEEGDVRGTSSALLALYELGEPPDSLLVDGAFRWLERQLKVEKCGAAFAGKAWEAEVWDTSHALTAFKRIKGEKGTLPDVEQWLHRVRSLNNRWPTWHDEPWETCLAAAALIEPPTSDCSWLPGTLNWLNSQLVQVNGAWSLHDNYHYTALYLLLVESIRENSQEPRLSPLVPRLDLSSYDGCLDYLVGGLRDDAQLWSGEVWLNAYCLLALVKADYLSSENESKCIDWFGRHSYRGAFGSIDDTAMAIRALYALHLRREQRRLVARLNEGQSEEKAKIIQKLIKDGHPRYSAMQRLRKDMIVAPPRIWTPRVDGSWVFYLSKAHKQLVLSLLAAAVGILPIIAVILEIKDRWPF